MIILCLVYAVCLLWTDDVDEQLSEAETPKSKKKKKAKKVIQCIQSSNWLISFILTLETLIFT